MAMPSGIHHLAIQVRDLPGAERFYCDVLGFAVVRRWLFPRSTSAPPSSSHTSSDTRAAAAASGDGTPGETTGGERSLWLDLGDGGRTFLALERVLGDELTAAEESGGRLLRPGHHLLAFAIDVSERSEWENRLRAAGVRVTHRTSYTIYFTDPEGNRLGLSHHPKPVSADET
jgi:glyoxylase I family protein